MENPAIDRGDQGRGLLAGPSHEGRGWWIYEGRVCEEGVGGNTKKEKGIYS